jgi:tryptophan synthase alpha chain
VGFGVSRPEHARAVAEMADGVVVGSAIVRASADGPGPAFALTRALRAAVDSVVPEESR